MRGLMMEEKLLVSSILDHAATYHSDTEIVSVNTNGGIHRTDYESVRKRALKLASAINKHKLTHSDRVATLAWNNYRHFELYYAISGNGLVCHTINPRLFPDQLVYIMNHADDKILFFDQTFIPLVSELKGRLETIDTYVLMEARDEEIVKSHSWIEFYEDFLEKGDDDYAWPEVDEHDASGLCYTSGTTGNPKGVLYSNRTMLMHAMMSATPDVMNFSAQDCVLPVVPMFHVNAWGTPYSAPLVGAKLVLPGPNLDGKSLTDLFNKERVTVTAGVPTIWAGLLQHLEDSGDKLPHLERTVVGGAACPPAMIEKFRELYDVEVIHAWGMTELSPLGSMNYLKNKHLNESEEVKNKLRESQGRPPYGMQLGVFDDDDNQLPNDGESQGNLYARGHWTLSTYFGGEGGDPLRKDWYPTGDVATIDQDGYMQIRDRSKDIIKSGGEWISTVDLENLAMGYPDVADAAAIAAKHEKWDERPLLIVVPKQGTTIDENALLDYYKGKVAKFCIPDAVKVVDSIPRNATGKVQKNVLREEFGDIYLTK